MHIQDLVAIVGDDAAAIDRFTAELAQFAGDKLPSHRDHLDRQGETSHHVHHLATVDDADETLGHGGDNFFPGQSGATAFNHLHLAVDLIGAVDVDVEGVHFVEIHHWNAQRLEAQGRGF